MDNVNDLILKSVYMKITNFVCSVCPLNKTI